MVIYGVPWNVHSFSPWNVQNSRYPTIDHLTFPSLWHPWFPHSAPRLWKWPQQWSDPISDDIANFTRPSVSQSFSPWNQMKSTNLKYISHDFPWWIVSKSSQIPIWGIPAREGCSLDPWVHSLQFPANDQCGSKKGLTIQQFTIISYHFPMFSPDLPTRYPHVSTVSTISGQTHTSVIGERWCLAPVSVKKKAFTLSILGLRSGKTLVLEDRVFKYVVLQCSSSKNWSPILSSWFHRKLSRNSGKLPMFLLRPKLMYVFGPAGKWCLLPIS